MVLGKKVAIFDWEWGRNSVPREGQKMPWKSDWLSEVNMDLNDGILYAGISFCQWLNIGILRTLYY